MKKGRHRRYVEARALKERMGSQPLDDSLMDDGNSEVDPELLAKWADVAEEYESTQDDDEEDSDTDGAEDSDVAVD